MFRKALTVFLACGLVAVVAGIASAGIITVPGDPIVGLHNTVAGGANTLSTPGTGHGQYPNNESPPNAIDNNQGSKYLNFGGTGNGTDTGFYVTPSAGVTVVTGLRFSTANDAPERDPLTFTLEGTNGDPASAAWTLIASGNTGLQTNPGRNTWQTGGSEPAFTNTVGYTSYRLLFPGIRGPNQNSMQIGEVQILGEPVPEPSAIVLGFFGLVGLLGWRIARRR